MLWKIIKFIRSIYILLEHDEEIKTNFQDKVLFYVIHEGT